MPLITWSPKYSVGIPSIDEQHQKLMQIMNTLFDGMQAGKGKEILGKILEDLIAYIDLHFQYEEDLFEKTNYADILTHKAEHEELTHKLLIIQEKFNEAPTGALSLEVLNLLKSWVSSHLLETDMKYAAFLASKGIK